MLRTLHPGAWWLWALGCAVAVTRTTNPLILVLMAVVVVVVTLACRGDGPQAANFRLYAWLAIVLLAIRMLFRLVFQGAGPTVLLALPTVTLPKVLTGATLLGPLSAEALVGGFCTGAQLALLVLCVGAANTLSNPKRLLAALPSAVYELGTTVVVAVSVFPQLAESVRRVMRSRLLRDDRGTWRHMIRDVMMPVLSDALDRSLLLAGAMDARGYGRTQPVTASHRRLTTGLLLLALVAICVGAFGVFDPVGGLRGWLTLGVGALLAAVALRLAGRRIRRTRYRRDPWTLPEWALTVCAVVTAGAAFWMTTATPAVANPPSSPLAWPPLAWTALAMVAAAVVPAIIVSERAMA